MTSQPPASGGEGPSVSPPPPSPPPPPPPPPPAATTPAPTPAPTLPPPGPTPSLPDRHAEAVAPQVVPRRPEDDPHAIARAAVNVARARHEDLRRRRRARSAVVVIALLALIAAGVVAVQVLGGDEERADGTASDRSPTTTEALDDVLDRLDGAPGTASQSPTTVAAGTPDALFAETPDPSLSTAQLVDQLPLARIERASALPSFRTRQFVLRRFDAVGTPTASWHYDHDTTDGRTFMWEVPADTDAVARYLYFDGTWRHTYVPYPAMSRSPQRSGVAVVPPTAPYGLPALADLATFVPPAVEEFAHEVPLPAGVVNPSTRDPSATTQALLIDLAGLRAADPAAADAWRDSLDMQDVDDPALVDTTVTETKEVDPIAISSAANVWTIDVGRLHPPPGSALLVAVTGSADLVSELAVAVPDEGIWFQYTDMVGFDSPLQPSIDFGVNGWTPAG